MASRAARAADIELLILDVDGVMTDGRLYFDERGECLKVFHVRDGFGIRSLQRAGIEVAVITGRRSKAVAVRCRELDIRHLVQGADDKGAAFEALVKRLRVAPERCACIGDDTPDVPVMSAVGLAFAVADAHPDARRVAHAITSCKGGKGAVREVCDRLLAARARRELSAGSSRRTSVRRR